MLDSVLYIAQHQSIKRKKKEIKRLYFKQGCAPLKKKEKNFKLQLSFEFEWRKSILEGFRGTLTLHIQLTSHYLNSEQQAHWLQDQQRAFQNFMMCVCVSISSNKSLQSSTTAAEAA